MEGNFVFGLPDQNGQLMMNFDPNMKEEFIAQNQHLDSSEFGFIKDDNH